MAWVHDGRMAAVATAGRMPKVNGGVLHKRREGRPAFTMKTTIATTSTSFEVHRPAGAAVRLACALASMVVLATPALGQELSGSGSAKGKSSGAASAPERPLSPEREELKQRFQQRQERLDALRDDAVIGETWKGYIAALDDRLLSAGDRALVADENKDRKALYALVSDDRAKENKKVPARVVAERNATRKFEAAKENQCLKISEGRWIIKRDQDRADKIAKRKKEGTVGETIEGYLAAVSAVADRQVKALVDEENQSRDRMYAQIAKRLEKVSERSIAAAAGKEAGELVATGCWFRGSDGTWTKRSDE